MITEILIIAAFLGGGYSIGVVADFPRFGMLLGGVLFVLLKTFYFSQFARFLSIKRQPWFIRSNVWHDLLSRSGHAPKEDVAYKSVSLSKELMQQLLALPFGVVFIDSNSTIKQFNSRAEKLLELQNPDDLGKNLTRLVRQPEFIKALEYQSDRCNIKLKNYSNKSLLINVLPCCGMRLVLVQDITEVRRLRQARRELVANIAHELRTPLTIIEGYAETLEGLSETNKSPPEFVKAVTEILRQARQMNDIIENSLFLDQLDARKPDEKDWKFIAVDRLVKDIIADQQMRFASKKCVVHTKIGSDRQIFGSERELSSAFSNLLNNALRHSDDGGELTLYWYVDVEGGHFSVIDKGEGIESKKIAFLTERFYRVDHSRADKYGGTGLGLAIVKHVLSRHNASLLIDSEVGIGSTFRCDFPLSQLSDDVGSAESSGDV